MFVIVAQQEHKEIIFKLCPNINQLFRIRVESDTRYPAG